MYSRIERETNYDIFSLNYYKSSYNYDRLMVNALKCCIFIWLNN